MTDTGFFGALGEASEEALDTVVGGGALMVDAVTRPGRSSGRARRRGARANQTIAAQTGEYIDDAVRLPERLLHIYLRTLRGQARRKDVIGAVSRVVLEAWNRPATAAAGFFSRIERETEPGVRARRASGTSRAEQRGRRAAGTVRRAATATRRGAIRGRRQATGGRVGARRGRRVAA